MAVVNLSLFSEQPDEGKTKTMNFEVRSQEIQKVQSAFLRQQPF